MQNVESFRRMYKIRVSRHEVEMKKLIKDVDSAELNTSIISKKTLVRVLNSVYSYCILTHEDMTTRSRGSNLSSVWCSEFPKRGAPHYLLDYWSVPPSKRSWTTSR